MPKEEIEKEAIPHYKVQLEIKEKKIEKLQHRKQSIINYLNEEHE